jgi:hypothetical protein
MAAGWAAELAGVLLGVLDECASVGHHAHEHVLVASRQLCDMQQQLPAVRSCHACNPGLVAWQVRGSVSLELSPRTNTTAGSAAVRQAML